MMGSEGGVGSRPLSPRGMGESSPIQYVSLKKTKEVQRLPSKVDATSTTGLRALSLRFEKPPEPDRPRDAHTYTKGVAGTASPGNAPVVAGILGRPKRPPPPLPKPNTNALSEFLKAHGHNNSSQPPTIPPKEIRATPAATPQPTAQGATVAAMTATPFHSAATINVDRFKEEWGKLDGTQKPDRLEMREKLNQVLSTLSNDNLDNQTKEILNFLITRDDPGTKKFLKRLRQTRPPTKFQQLRGKSMDEFQEFQKLQKKIFLNLNRLVSSKLDDKGKTSPGNIEEFRGFSESANLISSLIRPPLEPGVEDGDGTIMQIAFIQADYAADLIMKPETNPAELQSAWKGLGNQAKIQLVKKANLDPELLAKLVKLQKTSKDEELTLLLNNKVSSGKFRQLILEKPGLAGAIVSLLNQENRNKLIGESAKEKNTKFLEILHHCLSNLKPKDELSIAKVEKISRKFANSKKLAEPMGVLQFYVQDVLKKSQEAALAFKENPNSPTAMKSFKEILEHLRNIEATATQVGDTNNALKKSGGVTGELETSLSRLMDYKSKIQEAIPKLQTNYTPDQMKELVDLLSPIGKDYMLATKTPNDRRSGIVSGYTAAWGADNVIKDNTSPDALAVAHATLAEFDVPNAEWYKLLGTSITNVFRSIEAAKARLEDQAEIPQRITIFESLKNEINNYKSQVNQIVWEDSPNYNPDMQEVGFGELSQRTFIVNMDKILRNIDQIIARDGVIRG